MSNRDQQKQDNRLLMPECSAVVDAFRDAFGAEHVKVTYAAENGIVLGKKSDEEGAE